MDAADDMDLAQKITGVYESVLRGRLSNEQAGLQIEQMAQFLERWQATVEAVKIPPGRAAVAREARNHTLDGLRHYSHGLELLRRWLADPPEVALAREAIRSATLGERVIASLRVDPAAGPGEAPPDSGA